MPLPAKVKDRRSRPARRAAEREQVVPTAIKIELIERLADAGLRVIEATSFVSPKWVPQMGDNTAVMQGIRKHPAAVYPVLTPNLQGFDAALQAGATEVAIFGAASESFSKKNINCSIAESLKRFEPIVSAAARWKSRCAATFPASSAAPTRAPSTRGRRPAVAKTLFDMGCYEVSLGDTIGVGTPASIARMIEACAASVPIAKLAGHYHDTYGMAIANIYASLQLGMATFDSSIAGLGGCPYARGASGNVATEDVVYLMHGLGIETGIDLAKLATIGDWISSAINRPNGAKAGRAICARDARMSLISSIADFLKPAPPPTPGGDARRSSGSAKSGRPDAQVVVGFRAPARAAARARAGLLRGTGRGLPGPIDIDREAFAGDPLVHALFATADDIDQMLGRSQAVRDFHRLAGKPGKRLFLRTVRRPPPAEEATRHRPARATCIQGDVPQVVVYFADQSLVEPHCDLAVAQESAARRSMESLLMTFREHVDALRLERDGLRADASMERAHLTVLRGKTPGGDVALHTRHLDDLEARLRDKAESLMPDQILDSPGGFPARTRSLPRRPIRSASPWTVSASSASKTRRRQCQHARFP